MITKVHYSCITLLLKRIIGVFAARLKEETEDCDETKRKDHSSDERRRVKMMQRYGAPRGCGSSSDIWGYDCIISNCKYGIDAGFSRICHV